MIRPRLGEREARIRVGDWSGEMGQPLSRMDMDSTWWVWGNMSMGTASLSLYPPLIRMRRSRARVFGAQET